MFFTERFSILIFLTISFETKIVLSTPTFQKVECQSIVENGDDFDLCLEVNYDNSETDYAILNEMGGEETVFWGQLLEEGTNVAVTIEDPSNPDELEIVMSSIHAPDNTAFHANLNSFTSSPITFPSSDEHGEEFNDSYLELNDTLSSYGSEGRANLTALSAVLPSNGFRLPIHVFYDDTFNARFGSAVNTRIAALFTVVKAIYSHSSLTTIIRPEVIEITYVSGATWTATGTTLQSVSQNIATPATSLANAYVFLCSQNDQGGTIGIAWVGGTCSNTRYGRSSVNEYLNSDVITGGVIAHEIGHNLGMYHDFGASTSTNKYDSNGNLCTGIGGYMDYVSNPNKWSTCSVEDYTTYYNSVNSWCLEPLTTTATTTTPIPTTEGGTAAPTDAPPTGETEAPPTLAPTTTQAPTVTPGRPQYPADDCEDAAVRIEDLCPILAGSGYCDKRCLLGSWTQAACRKSCEQCAPEELVSISTPTGPEPCFSDCLASEKTEETCRTYCEGNIDLLRNNSNVDIAFMMDATLSMRRNIVAAKENIASIVRNVKEAFSNNTVRVAFVAYRDYSERELRIETYDFTEDVEDFTTSLGNVRAFAGYDDPEDVLGGLNATLHLNWKEANKLIFQIGDAPPRGYCGEVDQKWACRIGSSGVRVCKTCTAIKEKDLLGPQAPDLFESIDENCMKYNVLQISEFQDPMVDGFTAIAANFGGAERFQAYDMKSGNVNFDEVSDSIIDSIKAQLERTNFYLNNPEAEKNRCIVA